MELERDRDAAEFPTTCVTSRFSNPETSVVPPFCESLLFFLGHSGEYGNGAKLVEKMSKSVMQLISIHF